MDSNINEKIRYPEEGHCSIIHEERWEKLQKVQEKIEEIHNEVKENQTENSEHDFDKWDDYIRKENEATLMNNTTSGQGYKVGSYDDMSEGANTIKNMGENLHTELSSNQSIANLKQDRVFMGPIADHVNDVWEVYKRATDNNIADLESNAGTLNVINANYQNTDANATKEMRDLV